MIAAPLGALRVTGKLRVVEAPWPSVTVAEPMETVGAPSSLVIVPVPVAVPSVAFVGSLNCTGIVSSASASVSPRTETVTVFVVSPAAKVSVPSASAV